jgi:hypothetical protein
MKKSIASESSSIYLRAAVFGLTFVVSTFVSAANPLKPGNPPSMGPTAPSEISRFDPNTTSQNNALAAPDGQNSGASLKREPILESDLLPRSVINKLIVQMIERMPKGGEYQASSESMEKLASAIQIKGNNLDIHREVAMPSFCSSATYLLFVSVLEQLHKNKHLTFEPSVVEKLRVTGQHDGVGVWGRWNANGPGTARLFEELQLGNNFTSIDQAEPGDFLKIFWNDQIGAKEFGHSVIYLGRGTNGSVKYWSSNKKGGYSRTEVPQSKIKRTLFSHLTNPERINQILYAPGTEKYLASMLVRNSTPEEMYEKVGITPAATADPILRSIVGKSINAEATPSKFEQEKQK